MTQELAYYELPPHNVTLDHVQGIFCFDQQKWNLFGLVEPRIDTEGIEAARDNPIAHSINSGMFIELRQSLLLPPAQFLDEWEGWAWHVDSEWPNGYRAVLKHRAHQVQRKLLGVTEVGNVITVDFRRSA